MSKFNNSLRNGHVSLGDDFDTVAEVTHLFGVSATMLPHRNWFNVPNCADTIAWLPAENGGNGYHNVPEFGPKSDERGWNEVLTISEYNDSESVTAERIDEELAKPLTRYVFWREENDGAQWYKFVGTFKIDADLTKATRETEQPHVVYRRCDTTAACLKVEEVKQTFTDEEFMALKGHVVRVNFLDEIAFTADCERIVNSNVKAWPGCKLFVTDVTSGCVHVTCDTRDENLLAAAHQRIPMSVRRKFKKILGLSIPRNDFALGYVEALPGTGAIGDTFAALSPDCDQN